MPISVSNKLSQNFSDIRFLFVARKRAYEIYTKFSSKLITFVFKKSFWNKLHTMLTKVDITAVTKAGDKILKE